LPKERLKYRPKGYGLGFLPEPAHMENSSRQPSGCRLEEKGERLESSGWELDLSGDLE